MSDTTLDTPLYSNDKTLTNEQLDVVRFDHAVVTLLDHRTASDYEIMMAMYDFIELGGFACYEFETYNDFIFYFRGEASTSRWYFLLQIACNWVDAGVVPSQMNHKAIYELYAVKPEYRKEVWDTVVSTYPEPSPEHIIQIVATLAADYLSECIVLSKPSSNLFDTMMQLTAFFPSSLIFDMVRNIQALDAEESVLLERLILHYEAQEQNVATQ